MKYKNLGWAIAPGVLAVIITASIPCPGATVRRVRQDGTGNYTTIQACVNAMAAGDTCLVGPGVYPERVKLSSSKSGSANQLTVLRAETNGTVETYGFDTANCNYLHIEGFGISVPTNVTTWPDLYGIAVRSSNVEVVSNYVHDVASFGIFATTASDANERIAGNRLYKVGTGIVINGTGWLVEGNEIERLVYSSSVGDADYCIFFGSNHVIRSNYWHGTSSAEIGPAHVDGFQTYDQGGTAQHVRIEGNLVADFYHQGCMLEATLYTNSFDIVICNNIFRNAVSWGVCATRGIRNVQIDNNLFIDINSSGVGINDGATGEINNNIFYNVTGWDSATPASTGTKNLWFRPGGSVGTRFTGDIRNTDPKFVDVANGDYRLQTNSPAIDAGVTVASVLNDRDGQLRPQGTAYDIGPYEYVPSTTPARLLSPRMQESNIVFTLSGDNGTSYRIDATTDLQQWSQGPTVTIVNGSAQVTNPVTAALQFFRSVRLP